MGMGLDPINPSLAAERVLNTGAWFNEVGFGMRSSNTTSY